VVFLPVLKLPLVSLVFRGYYIRAAAVNHCLIKFLKAYSSCKTQVNFVLFYKSLQQQQNHRSAAITQVSLR